MEEEELSHMVGTEASHRCKKEERDRAFEGNKIPDICMHKDLSHLYGFDVSSMAPVTSFHEYQKVI